MEQALAALPHLELTRIGNTVVARTSLGRAERVVLAGHIDTVPLTLDPPNLPTRRVDGPGGEVLWGRGTVDMKGGVAVMLRRRPRGAASPAATSPSSSTRPRRSTRSTTACSTSSSSAATSSTTPTSPSSSSPPTPASRAAARAPCAPRSRPRASPATRPDRGRATTPSTTPPTSSPASSPTSRATREVDGLEFREALNAVLISGGIAGNVIPDRCVVTVNYRYAPDLSEADAEAHVRQVFSGFDVEVVDNAAGARPGLTLPAAQAFVEALGLPVEAKQGWTDVARFSAMGVPAVNFGPGDPNLAHMDDEQCPVEQYGACEAALVRWLA